MTGGDDEIGKMNYLVKRKLIVRDDDSLSWNDDFDNTTFDHHENPPLKKKIPCGYDVDLIMVRRAVLSLEGQPLQRSSAFEYRKPPLYSALIPSIIRIT